MEILMRGENLKQHLDNVALHYDECTFWEKYVQKCGEMILDDVRDKTVLEMGCSKLIVSKMLATVAKTFEIVEGSQFFCDYANKYFGNTVVVHQSLFEDFVPVQKYEAIVFTNTLHHLANPEEILIRTKNWLSSDGVVYITVPNMLSLHRRLGVKMGYLNDVFDSTERNNIYYQPGRFTKESLINLCQSCGFSVQKCFGFFLKPFSDEQMELLNPSNELMDALCEQGKEFEELSALLYIEIKANR